MEKKDDQWPEIKINNEKIKFSKKEEVKMDTLSPMFGQAPIKLDKKSKDKAAKSHHDFLKFTQDNKNPLGKTVEKKDYTKEEVALHNKKDDVWMIVKNKIYDVTKYMDYHPGGPGKLMLAAGKDGTSLFNQYHQWVNVDFILGKYEVGKLKY